MADGDSSRTPWRIAAAILHELGRSEEIERRFDDFLAAEIAENAPLAVIATRKTLRGDLAAAVRAQTAHEHAEQTILRATEDFAEGVRAVQERRPGVFKGR